jgi:VWFA-related protein
LYAAALVSTCAPVATAQQPQFRAAVETVRVDAVVTDGDGNFIDDLRAGEFTLFEDGEQREIVTVELVDLANRQVRRIGSEVSVAPNAPPAATSSAAGERASDLGAIVFFIDLPGLYFKSSADFADSMERLFSRTAQLELPYAIYLVDMAGRLRELQPLTTDLEALREAADAARATTSPVFMREYLFGAVDVGEGGAYRADRGEARGRTLYTYRLLRDFVDSLAHRAGRTALVWVSTGVDLAAYENVVRPYALLGQANPTPGSVFRTYNPDLKVLDLQEQLHRAANSANVSIYAVDPSALADFFLTPGGSLKRRDGSTEDARGNSLRNAAHATGGDVFIGWTELDRVLETIERDAGRFYLLSYVDCRRQGQPTSRSHPFPHRDRRKRRPCIPPTDGHCGCSPRCATMRASS